MSTLVSINKLSKYYQRGSEKVQVLQNLDLEIEQGDFLALMGPSGSGHFWNQAFNNSFSFVFLEPPTFLFDVPYRSS